jgi:hypothetical protein
MKNLFLFLLITLPFFNENGSNLEPVTSVEGKLFVSTKANMLKGDFHYTYISTDITRSTLSFFLSPDMEIDAVIGGNVKSYSFDRNARPFATLNIEFKRPLVEGERMKFSLSYSGTTSQGLWTGDHHWVDLDPDFMLLPLFNTFETFTYSLEATIDDPNYQFVDLEKGEMNEVFRTETKTPPYYFNPVLASDNKANGLLVNRVPVNDKTATIFSNEADSSQYVGDAVVRIFDFFNSTFGREEVVNSCSILYRPLPRPLHRVTRSFDRSIVFSYSYSNIATLAHEIAHFWWNRGNALTTEKWLSESFAQYSEMMFIRQDQGEEKFSEIITGLEKQSAKLPPLLGGDRFGSHGDDLIYVKGPFLLYQLEEQIGREKFVDFMVVLNRKKVSTTQKLLTELEQLTDKEVRAAFEEKLKS